MTQAAPTRTEIPTKSPQPAREEQGRWRAVWHESGARQQCEATSEEKLPAKPEKVTERPEADAPNVTLGGADVTAGLGGGYLASSPPAKVHRQAGTARCPCRVRVSRASRCDDGAGPP